METATATRWRYVVTYDEDPDYSYLEQASEDGGPLFGALTADDLTTYVVVQEKRCDCCGSWVDQDAVGGFDVETGSADDVGPGVFDRAELPEFMREHFTEAGR